MATAEYQAEYRRKWREDNQEKVKLNMEKSNASRRMRNTPNKEYARQLDTPDLLIGTLEVKLTDTQSDYLSLYMDEPRTTLMKMFNQRFNLRINKLQFNQMLHGLKEKGTTPRVEIKQSPGDNVYWVPKLRTYVVRFVREGVRTTLGYWMDVEKAKEAADEYRLIYPAQRKRK